MGLAGARGLGEEGDGCGGAPRRWRYIVDGVSWRWVDGRGVGGERGADVVAWCAPEVGRDVVAWGAGKHDGCRHVGWFGGGLHTRVGGSAIYKAGVAQRAV